MKWERGHTRPARRHIEAGRGTPCRVRDRLVARPHIGDEEVECGAPGGELA